MYLARDPFSSSTPLQLLGNAITALSKQDDEWPNFGFVNLSIIIYDYCINYYYSSDILAAQATVLLRYGSLCTHQSGGSKHSKIEYESLEAAMGVLEQALQKYVLITSLYVIFYCFSFCISNLLSSFKQIGCVPQIVTTLIILSRLVTDNVETLTTALMLSNAIEREEDGREEEGEEGRESELELLSKAMELLLQAQEYAYALMDATVVTTIF